ncbi:MAG: alkaline phosphatase D family protein [Spirosomataceae bacterium]
MKKTTMVVWLLCLVAVVALPVSAQIQCGPMVCYSDMKEVMVWIQTKAPAKVKLVYFDQASPTQKHSTDEMQTEKAHAYTAHLVADEVEPGKKYTYEVWLNGKKLNFTYPLSFQTQTLWQWRTDPPNFKFVVGSCTYINEEGYDRPGTPYGSNTEIFTNIYKEKPDFMIWTGDNNYLREPDWNTRTGVFHRYSHSRSVPEMQPLLASTHHYAIWDDHDYGPNDSDRGFWTKNLTLEAFKTFWGNPNYIFENEGITGTFMWNDCQFFLLDDRWWRSPNHSKEPHPDYFGEKQVKWLMDALTTSQAPFKFVIAGGQVINPAKIFENYANYEEERNQLLKAITDAKIPGVMFISGDRHHSVLMKLDRPGAYPLYDLTISPLTSGPGKPVKEEENTIQVDGTLVTERNFATLEITGKRTDRVLKISVFGTKGDLKWTKEIKANELK